MAAPVAAYVATRTGRRPLRRLLPGLILLALLGLALISASILMLAGLGQQRCGEGASAGSYAPSKAALSDIPGNYLGLYVAAGRRYGIDWAVLAGIGSIETDHGRLDAPGVRSGENFAGAGGPMQFLAPTWAEHGVDGDRDGDRDRYDPRDAIPAAANYLRVSGAQQEVERAIFAYNHASWYVQDVLERAEGYRGAAKQGGLPKGGSSPSGGGADAGGGGCPGGGKLAVGRGNGADVLRNRKIEVYPGGQQDLRGGAIDPRVTGLLLSLAADHTLVVTSLKSGHSTYTASGNVSNHASGRAVDIAAVDGTPCTDTSRSGPCGQVARQIAAISGPSAPEEVIFCFDPGAGSNSFAQADHCDHVHVGFGARG